MMKSAEGLFLVLISGTIVILGAVLGLVGAQKGYTICDVQGCNCTVPAGGWKNVNCFLLDDQDLVLEPGHIPKETTEIFITGGKRIIFTPKTFNGLQALAFLRLERVRRVVAERKAFFNIQYSSLFVQIIGCDDLLLRSQAFDEMQGSLSTEIVGSKYVKIENSPFSKLSNGTFQDIEELTLDEGAFEIKNLGSIGRHGPVSVVLFVNVFIPEIPTGVFLSSLAEIAFKDSRIGIIYYEAFKSAQISTVLMTNSNFHTIGTGTFTDRTLVVDFRISKCMITKLQTKAIRAGMTNLIVNHSTITDIETHAIASTAAKVEFVGNQILNFHSTAITIQNWNRIIMDQNIIINLYRDFIVTSINPEIELFSFKGNEIHNAMEGSLSFVPKLEDGKLLFDDNYFNHSCGCELQDWINQLTNSTSKRDLLMDTSFCRVNEYLSKCFSLAVGIINMQNFTEKACNNETICEPYNGEERTINSTGIIFIEHSQDEKQNWLIFIIVFMGCIIIALVSTFVLLLIKGSRWLKRKGYFRNSYYNNNRSNEEEENTIVTIDTENEKLEIPEELTVDFLHELSRRLDDPSTHQEAREMIERLYEMFVVEDSYENNNREEEAHLYEELSNLNLQIPPPPYQEQPPPIEQSVQTSTTQNTSPRGILRLMEEKFNTNSPNGILDTQKTISSDLSNTSTSSTKPILSGDYSEPIDRDVHLYSELKQKDESKANSVNSNGSMAMRPLPSKPGPSTKM